MAYPPFHPEGESNRPALLPEQDFRSRVPGEGDHVEFKQGVSGQEIEKATSAFSNADGGVVFIGVGPDGSLHDRPLDGEIAARLHRTARNATNVGRYELYELIVGTRHLLVIAVARRREGVAQTSAGVPLVRRGAMNVPLVGAELSALVNQRALQPFERTSTELPFPEAESPLLAEVADAWQFSGSRDDLEERFTEQGLVDRSTGSLTVAGALCLSPSPEQVVSKAFVEILRYRSGELDYDQRFEVRGPVHRQVEETTRAIMNELGSELVVLGTRRYELARIPEVVVRETVANAVAHRSYEFTGSPIRVEITTESVTVTSPGPLPEPVTVENMREQNASRNVAVIGTLRRLGLAEEIGRGIDVIQDTMQEQLLDAPRFEDNGSRVVVMLPLRSTVTSQERAWINEVERRGEIRPRDRIVLVHAARGEVLTNGYVRDLLSVDSVEARGALHRLRDAGFVTQSGKRGGAQYRLAGDMSPPAGLKLDDRQLGDLVLALANEGPVTNSLVRDRTGLDRAQALSVLSALVEDGLLAREGERRGVRYVLPDQASLDI